MTPATDTLAGSSALASGDTSGTPSDKAPDTPAPAPATYCEPPEGATLGPDGPFLARTLVLVGLMGAGKTSVGRRLAQGTPLRFVDADSEIETAAGQSISDIFATLGEAEFRAGERRVMARLLQGPVCILATGGGAFMAEQTRAIVRARGISVWLKADLDLLVQRTAGRSHRPLLAQGDGRAKLAALIEQRYPVYAEADITVEVRDEPQETTVDRVRAAVARHLEQHPDHRYPAPPAPEES